jgi:hypothetical protein
MAFRKKKKLIGKNLILLHASSSSLSDAFVPYFPYPAPVTASAYVLPLFFHDRVKQVTLVRQIYLPCAHK